MSNQIAIRLIDTSIEVNSAANKKTIVSNVNAIIYSGEIFAIMGGSGSGNVV